MIDVETTMQCPQCGYDLRGLPSPRCPECGRAFDPEDPESFIPKRHPAILWLTFAAAGFALAATGPLMCVIASAFSNSPVFGVDAPLTLFNVGICATPWGAIGAALMSGTVLLDIVNKWRKASLPEDRRAALYLAFVLALAALVISVTILSVIILALVVG